MPEGMRFFSSKVRNNFLFYPPSLIRHCGISRGLCFPCKPAHQMTPMHQLGAVLTGTKGRVVLTLVQWLTAPCSSGDTSRTLRIHPAFSPCSWRWISTCCTSCSHNLILPITSFQTLWQGSECPCEAALNFESVAPCLLRETKTCPSFRSSLLENKVNLIVLEQMASFHVVAFPWLNGAWLDINIKCSYMWIYKYSNQL